MIFETVDWTRLALVYTSQLFVIICFLTISIKILKRNKSTLSIIFSLAYISVIIALIINIIYLPIQVNPSVHILHVMSIFIFFFGLIFHPLFNITLLRLHTKVKVKKFLILVLFYGVILLLLLISPGAIVINETTEWKPIWSVSLAISLYFFLTAFILLPTIIIAIKIYVKFQDESLKRKYRKYFLGFCGYAINFYGGVYYNTTPDQIFKQAWSILSLMVIPFGLLIYYGLGRQIPSYFPDKSWNFPSFSKISVFKNILDLNQ